MKKCWSTRWLKNKQWLVGGSHAFFRGRPLNLQNRWHNVPKNSPAGLGCPFQFIFCILKKVQVPTSGGKSETRRVEADIAYYYCLWFLMIWSRIYICLRVNELCSGVHILLAIKCLLRSSLAPVSLKQKLFFLGCYFIRILHELDYIRP